MALSAKVAVAFACCGWGLGCPVATVAADHREPGGQDASNPVDAAAVADGAACSDASPIDAAGSAQTAFIVTVLETVDRASSAPWAWVSASDCASYCDSYDGYGAEVDRAGDCIYREPDLSGICEPACTPPEFCSPDGECRLPRVPVSAGTIAVSGLLVGATLVPQPPQMYYQPQFDPEPVDGNLFEPGAVITATAAGAEIPAFTLSTSGVAAMQTALACPFTLQNDVDYAVDWTAETDGDQVYFMITGTNHAEQGGNIVCAAADSGHLVVAGRLISRFNSSFHVGARWQLLRTRQATTSAGATTVTLRSTNAVACSQW
ncbi:MAG: hypothetical protein JXR83_03955 [Deltaproteobacteria bacterium]|nr:hypothetical protein [Deltaproteobacteria bacterium]